MKSCLFGLLCVAMLACAAPVLIDSQAGLPVTPNSGSGTVAIALHQAWQTNNPVNPGDPGDNAAVWISWAQTGYGGSVFQAPWDPNNPAPQMIVSHTFVSGAGMLNLNVWADDTAGVFLDGTELWPPKTDTNSTCSGFPVGCVPGDVKNIISPIAAGSHTLEFKVYQTGTGTNTLENPFGLLYTGAAPAVPEPATTALIGAGLVFLGVAGRRFRARRA